MIGLDTNVLLRWLVDGRVWPDEDGGQLTAARRLIAEGGHTFFVNAVVVAETVWVLTAPLDQKKDVVIDVMDRLLSSSNVVVDQREAVVAALIEYRRSGRPGFTDHLIGQINRHAGCETTVSFDKGTSRSGAFRRLRPLTS